MSAKSLRISLVIKKLKYLTKCSDLKKLQKIIENT